MPAGTVAVAGGLAAGELLERLTTAPPAGAAPVSITMADVATPPVIGVNTLTLWSVGGRTVNEADAVDALSVAVRVTTVVAETPPTWNRN